MFDILNLALPYFGLIFIGFASGKAKGLPEQGLAWMNFFLLYVSLPALLFGRLSFREATLAGRDVVDPDRPAGVSVKPS